MEFETVTDRDIFAECIQRLAQRDVVLDLGGRRRFHKRLSAWESQFAGMRYYCGGAFFYVPFLYPYHGSQGTPDCYRFTRDALYYMFRDFSRLQL